MQHVTAAITQSLQAIQEVKQLHNQMYLNQIQLATTQAQTIEEIKTVKTLGASTHLMQSYELLQLQQRQTETIGQHPSCSRIGRKGIVKYIISSEVEQGAGSAQTTVVWGLGYGLYRMQRHPHLC